MAWTAPVTRATGYVVLAADWNAEHVGDLQYLHGDAGAISLGASINLPGLTSSLGVLAGQPLGYSGGIGVGASVTQITSRNTAVTINNPCGQIVTNATSLANGATAIFTVNNSFVQLSDTINLNINNNALGASQMIPIVSATAAGSFQISYTNLTGAATTQFLGINFAILRSTYN